MTSHHQILPHVNSGENEGAYNYITELSIVRKVASSGMLHRMALVRTDVSEELSASIIRGDKNL
jgi:hypothetical protein